MTRPIDGDSRGIDVEGMSFDDHGEINGLDDDFLDTISGGLMMEEGNNTSCDPPKNCKC